MIRPWLFLGPALIILDRLPDLSGGRDALALLPRPRRRELRRLRNYAWAFGDREFRQSIFNNLLWLLVVPAACTFFGLVIAVLTDRSGGATSPRR